jgi:hypothetical protein
LNILAGASTRDGQESTEWEQVFQKIQSLPLEELQQMFEASQQHRYSSAYATAADLFRFAHEKSRAMSIQQTSGDGFCLWTTIKALHPDMQWTYQELQDIVRRIRKLIAEQDKEWGPFIYDEGDNVPEGDFIDIWIIEQVIERPILVHFPGCEDGTRFSKRPFKGYPLHVWLSPAFNASEKIKKIYLEMCQAQSTNVSVTEDCKKLNIVNCHFSGLASTAQHLQLCGMVPVVEVDFSVIDSAAIPNEWTSMASEEVEAQQQALQYHQNRNKVNTEKLTSSPTDERQQQHELLPRLERKDSDAQWKQAGKKKSQLYLNKSRQNSKERKSKSQNMYSCLATIADEDSDDDKPLLQLMQESASKYVQSTDQGAGPTTHGPSERLDVEVAVTGDSDDDIPLIMRKTDKPNSQPVQPEGDPDDDVPLSRWVTRSVLDDSNQASTVPVINQGDDENLVPISKKRQLEQHCQQWDGLQHVTIDIARQEYCDQLKTKTCLKLHTKVACMMNETIGNAMVVKIGEIVGRVPSKKDVYNIKFDGELSKRNNLILRLVEQHKTNVGVYGLGWVVLEDQGQQLNNRKKTKVSKVEQPKITGTSLNIESQSDLARHSVETSGRGKSKNRRLDQKNKYERGAECQETLDTKQKQEECRQQHVAHRHALAKCLEQAKKKSIKADKDRTYSAKVAGIRKKGREVLHRSQASMQGKTYCEVNENSDDEVMDEDEAILSKLLEVEYPEVRFKPDHIVFCDLDKMNAQFVPVEVIERISRTIKNATYRPVGHEECENVIISVDEQVGVLSIQCHNEAECHKILDRYIQLNNNVYVKHWEWRSGVPKHHLADGNHTFNTRSLVQALKDCGHMTCRLSKFGQKIRIDDALHHGLYSFGGLGETHLHKTEITFDIGMVLNMWDVGRIDVVNIVAPNFLFPSHKKRGITTGLGFSVFRQGGLHGEDTEGCACGTLLFEVTARDDLGVKYMELPQSVDVDGQEVQLVHYLERISAYTDSVHILKVGANTIT